MKSINLDEFIYANTTVILDELENIVVIGGTVTAQEGLELTSYFPSTSGGEPAGFGAAAGGDDAGASPRDQLVLSGQAVDLLSGTNQATNIEEALLVDRNTGDIVLLNARPARTVYLNSATYTNIDFFGSPEPEATYDLFVSFSDSDVK